MSAPNAEKGARYLAQLDSSLCAGAWHDIPEQSRKVDKHAPDRACLTLTARAEAQVASASHRPTSASSSASSSIHSLGELIPRLQRAIDGETRHAEDAYVASICLAEIQWLRGAGEEALGALDRSNTTQSASGHVTALGWREVCEVKANFIRGAVLEEEADQGEARQLYLTVATRSPGSRSAELRRWTERLLARACMFMWRRADPQSIPSLSDALSCFQSWSDFWQRAPPPMPQSASHLDRPRRDVWKAYYYLLSDILQQGLLYSPTNSSTVSLFTTPDVELSDQQLSSARRKQRVALKQVEATYESLLLNETRFPKASQTNTEIEDWVEHVIRNWKVFCQPQWTAVELGEGGRQAVSQNVLDILYRASTKSFHSTAILRQLFTVHASRGEFDLAIQAFDSYVEIVSQGKTRAEKTGKHEIGFDSDDTAVCTAAEAIRLLCLYGDREQAEKANKIVRTLRKWLGQGRAGSSATVDTVDSDRTHQTAAGALTSSTMAAAYRAMGICKLHWARLTFENDSRTALRLEAINSLRQAQAHDQSSIEDSLSLALCLAESGDFVSAAQTAKTLLAGPGVDSDDEDETVQGYHRERRLLPVWHLLALCRSADGGYAQAADMCESAFDQFGEPSVLFGEDGIRTSIDSEKLPVSVRGLVDQMEASEKESIVQIKMTQLSLIELAEGSEVAVRTSEGLLVVYTRLFGAPSQPRVHVEPPATAASTTPSRPGGTLRSIAGSMRPRSRSARRGAEREQNRSSARIDDGQPATQANGHTSHVDAPIAITVTNEDGVPAENHHRHLPFKLRGHHHDTSRPQSLMANEQMNEKSLPATAEKTRPSTNQREEQPLQPVPIKPATHSDPENDASSPQQPIAEIPHNAPSSDAWPPPPGHHDQPPKQDVRLPAPHPASRDSRPQTYISGLQERQHKFSLLVEVWLFIAGMYLRAAHFDDCTAAVDAAFRLVEQLEEDVAVEEGSSARRFFEKGWGLGKSVDELWGDVWAAVCLPASCAEAFC